MKNHFFNRFSVILALILGSKGSAHASHLLLDERSCQPVSPATEEAAFLPEPFLGIPQDFCAQWNPDYAGYNYKCCSEKGMPKRKKKNVCPKYRATYNHCSERTPEQIAYEKRVATKHVDLLSELEFERGRNGHQAFCTGANGFIAFGKPVLATPENRLNIMSAPRCVNYGTDEMVLVLDWLGHQVHKRYSGKEYEGVRLLVADVSAPRGGCLTGGRGRRAHASHTNGRDADIGFLSAKPGRASDVHFNKKPDYETNAWLLRTLFSNPYACVDVVFVDKKHMKNLFKYMKDDPQWPEMSRRIQHVRGHRDHFHIRVGFAPGKPGCPKESHDDDISEDMIDHDNPDADKNENDKNGNEKDDAEKGSP